MKLQQLTHVRGQTNQSLTMLKFYRISPPGPCLLLLVSFLAFHLPQGPWALLAAAAVCGLMSLFASLFIWGVVPAVKGLGRYASSLRDGRTCLDPRPNGPLGPDVTPLPLSFAVVAILLCLLLVLLWATPSDGAGKDPLGNLATPTR